MRNVLSKGCRKNQNTSYFAFLTVHFLKVYEKPTNALIIQCIGTQYSPIYFGTLKYHYQGVKHDHDEIGAETCRRILSINTLND
jgi:hypothetical protein